MVCHPGVTDCQVCDRQSKGFESDENPVYTDPRCDAGTLPGWRVVGVYRHDQRYIYQYDIVYYVYYCRTVFDVFSLLA